MKPLLACLLALILAACALPRPAEERLSFLLQPRHAGACAGKRVGDSLRIGRVDIAPPFDGRAFVYRRDEVRYETDPYNEFAADPAAMVAEAAAVWLRPCGLFAEVLAPHAGSFAQYRLEGSISTLHVDFRGAVPAAVLSMRWRLLGDSDGELVLGLEREERVPLSERSPHGAALAYDEALRRALAALEAALQENRL